ncbi:MAG TPA: Crp/Fnr family transcriptional regulator [Burkholderiales bacterium]|jgi:SulP family sulfate permease|nr:Crp/Fnr family transcriptional regulator [Burkholderiales bacterium]
MMNGAAYAAVFVQEGKRAAPGSDTLLLPEWRIDDWRKLLAGTTVKPFRTSDVVIQRGVEERVLYFIAAGTLEVGVTTFDGVSISQLARIGPVSVIGEQSFFDGQPRSANVWAVTSGTLLRWELQAFDKFGAQEPRLARDVIFAVARVLSMRLRMTTIRVRR